MKKLFLLLILTLVTLKGYSPVNNCITIYYPPPICPYEALLAATGLVESGNNPMAYNPLEQACGIYQIRFIRLLDYFQRTGKRYSLRDCFNPQISKEIYLYYASQYQPSEFETIARKWNGSGVKTIEYWQKIKSKLKNT